MQDDKDPLARLRNALGMDAEPTLPGVVPPEPEQHRLPGMGREQAQPEAAAPEARDGNAQFLRDEDRTRPMPRPTPSMPGMGLYVGPVYPMQTGGFDRLAWGAGRTALPEPSLPMPPQAVPDIPEGSAAGRLMGALTAPAAPEPDPAQRREEQAAPAIEGRGQERQGGDPAPASPQAAQATRGQEPSQIMTEARDRLAELMERIDPGYAERQAAMSPEERGQQIEAQLQASQLGRGAHNTGREF